MVENIRRGEEHQLLDNIEKFRKGGKMTLTNETRLNPDQAWSLILIFLHMVRQDSAPLDVDAPLNPNGRYEEIGGSLYRYICDRECVTEWKKGFPKAIGRPFSSADRYTPDEVLATLFELALYHYEQLAIYHREYLIFLQSMGTYPEQFTKEWGFWQKAIEKVLNGEIWGNVENDYVLPSVPLPYQPNPEIVAGGVLELDLWLEVIYLFLENLCYRCLERFSNRGDSFAKYIVRVGIFRVYEWRRNYVRVTRAPYSPTASIDSGQAYLLMVHYLHRKAVKFKIDSREVLALLEGMDADPENHQAEWACWEQSMRDVTEGKRASYYSAYSFYAGSTCLPVYEIPAVQPKDPILSIQGAETVLWGFLKGILAKCPQRFPDKGVGPFKFEDFIKNVWYQHFEQNYSVTCLKPIPYDNSRISVEEVFQTIISIAALRCYLETYRIFEFIPLLYGMKCRPEQYPEECKLWNEVVQEAIEQDLSSFFIKRRPSLRGMSQSGIGNGRSVCSE